MERLMDKVAIVTGGGGGIGGATARALAREGAAVLVVDIDQAAAERISREIAGSGGRAEAFRADLSDEDQVVAPVAAATALFGRLSRLWSPRPPGRSGVLRTGPWARGDTTVGTSPNERTLWDEPGDGRGLRAED